MVSMPTYNCNSTPHNVNLMRRANYTYNKLFMTDENEITVFKTKQVLNCAIRFRVPTRTTRNACLKLCINALFNIDT